MNKSQDNKNEKEEKNKALRELLAMNERLRIEQDHIKWVRDFDKIKLSKRKSRNIIVI